MKAVFRYKRVLRISATKIAKRGKPSDELLVNYSRRIGEYLPHFRPYERGGYTLCTLVDEQKNVLATGEAWCSMSDAFNYKIGRLIAEGRARKAYLAQFQVTEGA